jgi:hypothetical protein
MPHSEGLWLHYEKADKGKLWKFALKHEGTRIDHMEWLDGAKPKAQKRELNTPEAARQAAVEMISMKERAGYRFVKSLV